MGSCMSLNNCNRSNEGHSGRRRHRNRRDQVECNGGSAAEAETDTRPQNTLRSPSFSNVTSTNGDNLIEPTSNSYQSTISNSFSANPRFIPPTGKNKKLKRDYIKYLKQSYENRIWASSSRKMTESQLLAKRDEFWHTAPAFDGKPEIWAALKASVEALEMRNYQLAQAIIDSANIILPNGIINDCYDELGNRYQLPIYVLLKPTNFRRKDSDEQNSNDFESESSTSKIEKTNHKQKKKKTKENSNLEENNDNLDDLLNCDLDESDDLSCYNNSQRKEIPVKSKKSKSKASTSNQAKSGNDLVTQKAQQQQQLANQSLQVKFRVSSFDQDNSKSDVKLTVNPNETVSCVKKRLYELYKIDPQSQRFYFAGKMMRDKEKLKAHNLKKNVVIQVIVRDKIASVEDEPNENDRK